MPPLFLSIAKKEDTCKNKLRIPTKKENPSETNSIEEGHIECFNVELNSTKSYAAVGDGSEPKVDWKVVNVGGIEGRWVARPKESLDMVLLYDYGFD